MSGDGGPAFPVTNEDWRMPQGMTLRDYFAAKAMVAYLSAGDRWPQSTDFPHISARAYEAADEMLKARDA